MKNPEKITINLFKSSMPLLFLVSNLAATCNAQDANYKAVPSSYLNAQTSFETYHNEAVGAMQGAYDLTLSLPANYVRDGSIDYTKYLQQGMSSNTKVVMPDFPVQINEQGLAVANGSTMIFNKNSSLVVAPTSISNFAALKVYNVKNVKIYEPVIVGERNKHTGKGGEWGMGISIRGSSGVVVYNPKVSQCWGDGIYFGDYKGVQTENVTIYNARLDFNRRNGISVVSGRNITIDGAVISNTSGTSPQSGIDIEPDGNKNFIEGISIHNVVTYNNVGSGLEICLKALPGPEQKTVSINVDGFVDEQSKSGLRLVGYNDHYDNASPLNGQIQITNSKLINNSVPVLSNSNYDFGPQTTISGLSIVKKDNNGVSSVDNNALNDIKRNLASGKISFQ